MATRLRSLHVQQNKITCVSIVATFRVNYPAEGGCIVQPIITASLCFEREQI